MPVCCRATAIQCATVCHCVLMLLLRRRARSICGVSRNPGLPDRPSAVAAVAAVACVTRTPPSTSNYASAPAYHTVPFNCHRCGFVPLCAVAALRVHVRAPRAHRSVTPVTLTPPFSPSHISPLIAQQRPLTGGQLVLRPLHWHCSRQQAQAGSFYRSPPGAHSPFPQLFAAPSHLATIAAELSVAPSHLFLSPPSLYLSLPALPLAALACTALAAAGGSTAVGNQVQLGVW